MRYTWVIWPIGALVIGIAGYLWAKLPKQRDQEAVRRNAWADAQAAIAAAGISKDATTASVPEAESLLMQAELLAARHGGPDAAGQAADNARRADQLWRATVVD